jgi:DNA topoisomerase
MRYAPAPLSTLELQKKCTQYLRMSGDHVMAAAEALYQRGLISYPRTETDEFDPAQDVQVCSVMWPCSLCAQLTQPAWLRRPHHCISALVDMAEWLHVRQQRMVDMSELLHVQLCNSARFHRAPEAHALPAQAAALHRVPLLLCMAASRAWLLSPPCSGMLCLHRPR